MLLVKSTSTHRVGQKAYFPKWILSKVNIPDAALKEKKFLSLHDYISKVDQYDIPSTLDVNIDQTPLKYVPMRNETITAKG